MNQSLKFYAFGHFKRQIQEKEKEKERYISVYLSQKNGSSF